ncbi:MAG: hypothetical protein ISS73_08395 [Pirellulales bacterium]|nr:hypothetical protein [Pirellulales bacterium]
MGDAFIRCRRLSACAVVVAQLFATGFVVSHCHGDEHGPAEWHSHGCHDDHRHDDHRHDDHRHDGHQHDGHQHPSGSGGCFEGHAGAAAAGRGGSAESAAPLELSRDMVAMADGLACPPREAGLQRRVAREAADAVGSVRDLRPHVLRI